MNAMNQVTIYEVGLRDGLQLEQKVLTVEEKAKVLHLLQKAKITEVEFGSFVNPKLVPQMANTPEFFAHIKNEQFGKLVGLVPNLKGLVNAKNHGVKAVNFVLSASDTHNQQKVRKTTYESVVHFKDLAQYASFHDIEVNVTLATSFGCPFEGKIPEKRVLDIVENLLDYNINRITLADTTGMANPKQVHSLMQTVIYEWSNVEIGCHFHNTRGMGLANILAGLEAGVTIFDTSLGGIGGCPFAPGATGNVCTEDVVHMLEEIGVKTNIDIDLLIQAAQQLKVLLDHELPGQVYKAGKSSRLYPVPS